MSLTVLAPSAVLERISRESRLARLAGIHSAEGRQDTGGPVRGLELSRLAAEARRLLSGDAGVDVDSIAEEFLPLFRPERIGVLVVLACSQTERFDARVEELRDILAAARMLVSFQSLDNPHWQLIAVCARPMTARDRDQLEVLRGLHCIEGREGTQLLSRCWIADWKFSESKSGLPAFAQHVWPMAVGRLIAWQSMQDRLPAREPDGAWYHAWTSSALVAPMHDPEYEEEVLRAMNEAMRSTAAEGVHEHPRRTQSWTKSMMSADRYPASSTDERLDPKLGYYGGKKGQALEGFVSAGDRAAIARFLTRCEPTAKGWEDRFGIRSCQMRIDQDKLQLVPFGEGDKPDKLFENAWQAMHDERDMVNWYSGAQALQQQDLGEQMTKAHGAWESVLDFEQRLADGVARTRELAEVHDELRGGFLAWWFRVLIASAVALFVGLTVTSLVSTVLGSLTMGAFIAGAVVSIAASGTTLLLWHKELRAGERGLQRLEQGFENCEQGVADSLRLRLQLLVCSTEMRSKSIWMSTSARIRLTATRVRMIFDMIRSEVFASARSMQESASAEGRASMKGYIEGTERYAGSARKDGVVDFVRHLQLQLQLSESQLSEFLRDERKAFAEKWRRFCEDADERHAGHLTVLELRREFQSELGGIRARVEAKCVDELIAKFDLNEEATLHARDLKNTAMQLSLLSVCIEGYALGVQCAWRIRTRCRLIEGIDGVEMVEEELKEWGGVLSFGLLELPLTLDEREGRIVFRAASGGGRS